MSNIAKSLRIITVSSLILFTAAGVMARQINVRGKVTEALTGEPLSPVSIYDASDHHLIGSTDEEGKFMVTIDGDGTLSFSILGCEKQDVKVDGRINIDVQMQRSAVGLNEVVVKAKRVTNKVLTEPTDIDVKGNYLHIKTRVKIPHELFSSQARMIVQPAIYNVTRKKVMYLDPVVFDGRKYAITQERMYDYHGEDDPLSKFVTVKTTGSGKDDVLYFRDSAYVENPKDDFRCDMMMSMETYNNIIYGDTTVIARGVINPLRFLDYSFAGTFVEDKKHLPKPEMQLRATKGNVNLTFKINSTKLDPELGNNRAELDKMLGKLREIESNPNAALKSISITGTASPEGRYELNLGLAKERMKSALDLILGELDPSTRKAIDIKSDASVERWESLVELLRADGRVTEADAVEAIIDRYPDNINRQSKAISATNFYRPLITDEYLPRLRKVDYDFASSIYRYLTDDEIAEMYSTNSAALSRHEFWRLYTLADSLDEKEAICRRALEVHPKFTVAATDLAAILIRKGEPDVELLRPYLAKDKAKAPNETRLNQLIASLGAGNYFEADSLAFELPDEGVFHKAKIITKALNGKYQDVIAEISKDSPFNEVLLLLALKANDEAWAKAKALGGSAKEEYIKAVAANRVDEVMAAINHMENAFRLDPSLKEIAKVDGDLLDLLEEE